MEEGSLGLFHLILKPEWFRSLAAFYASRGMKFGEAEAVEQFLHSDLKQSYISPVKIPGNAVKFVIVKPALFQVISVVNIAQPIYEQYRELTADRDNLSWFHGEEDDTEPAPLRAVAEKRRMLKIVLNDGLNTVNAVEYGSLTCIDENTVPGSKVLLTSRVLCRRGYLLLNDSNCQMLGGDVEELCEKFNRIEFLADLIGLKKKEREKMKAAPAVSNCLPETVPTAPVPLNTTLNTSTLSPFVVRLPKPKENEKPVVVVEKIDPDIQFKQSDNTSSENLTVAGLPKKPEKEVAPIAANSIADTRLTLRVTGETTRNVATRKEMVKKLRPTPKGKKTTAIVGPQQISRSIAEYFKVSRRDLKKKEASKDLPKINESTDGDAEMNSTVADFDRSSNFNWTVVSTSSSPPRREPKSPSEAYPSKPSPPPVIEQAAPPPEIPEKVPRKESPPQPVQEKAQSPPKRTLAAERNEPTHSMKKVAEVTTEINNNSVTMVPPAIPQPVSSTGSTQPAAKVAALEPPQPTQPFWEFNQGTTDVDFSDVFFSAEKPPAEEETGSVWDYFGRGDTPAFPTTQKYFSIDGMDAPPLAALPFTPPENINNLRLIPRLRRTLTEASEPSPTQKMLAVKRIVTPPDVFRGLSSTNSTANNREATTVSLKLGNSARIQKEIECERELPKETSSEKKQGGTGGLYLRFYSKLAKLEMTTLANCISQRVFWMMPKTKCVQGICRVPSDLHAEEGRWMLSVLVSDTSCKDLKCHVSSVFLEKMLGFSPSSVQGYLRRNSAAELNNCKKRAKSMSNVLKRLDLLLYIEFAPERNSTPTIVSLRSFTELIQSVK